MKIEKENQELGIDHPCVANNWLRGAKRLWLFGSGGVEKCMFEVIH